MRAAALARAGKQYLHSHTHAHAIEASNSFLVHSANKLSSNRKGSISLKESGRRDSINRRKDMVLGGLRVITSGGITAGIDAALYLVSALVSDESAERVAEHMQWTWTKGIVVDGLDVVSLLRSLISPRVSV